MSDTDCRVVRASISNCSGAVATRALSVNSALLTVILATIAFTALGYSGGMFGKQSAYARNVNAGYWIVCLVVMIICQGVIRGM